MPPDDEAPGAWSSFANILFAASCTWDRVTGSGRKKAKRSHPPSDRQQLLQHEVATCKMGMQLQQQQQQQQPQIKTQLPGMASEGGLPGQDSKTLSNGMPHLRPKLPSASQPAACAELSDPRLGSRLSTILQGTSRPDTYRHLPHSQQQQQQQATAPSFASVLCSETRTFNITGQMRTKQGLPPPQPIHAVPMLYLAPHIRPQDESALQPRSLAAAFAPQHEPARTHSNSQPQGVGWTSVSGRGRDIPPAIHPSTTMVNRYAAERSKLQQQQQQHREFLHYRRVVSKDTQLHVLAHAQRQGTGGARAWGSGARCQPPSVTGPSTITAPRHSWQSEGARTATNLQVTLGSTLTSSPGPAPSLGSGPSSISQVTITPETIDLTGMEELEAKGGNSWAECKELQLSSKKLWTDLQRSLSLSSKGISPRLGQVAAGTGASAEYARIHAARQGVAANEHRVADIHAQSALRQADMENQRQQQKQKLEAAKAVQLPEEEVDEVILLSDDEEEEEEDEEEEEVAGVSGVKPNSPVEVATWSEVMGGRGPPGEELRRHLLSNTPFTRASLHTLREGTWLNDEIINGCMGLLQEHDLEQHAGETTGGSHFFTTFFLNKLFKDAGKYGYKEVRRWTATKKLKASGQRCACVLSCDRLLFPVHVGTTHWATACIDLKERRLLYWDSLSNGKHRGVLDHLAQWVVDEAKDKLPPEEAALWADATSWPREVPQVPQQNNGCDCGVFSITFIAFAAFCRLFSFRQADMPTIRRRILNNLWQLKWSN